MTNMDKWLDVLRNGGYKQCQDLLRKNDRFCCLGVACDLFIKETWLARWEERDWRGCFAFCSDRGDCEGELPSPVREWLLNGVEDADWDKVLGGDGLAIKLNDEGFASFPEIAEAIDQWRKDRNP